LILILNRTAFFLALTALFHFLERKSRLQLLEPTSGHCVVYVKFPGIRGGVHFLDGLGWTARFLRHANLPDHLFVKRRKIACTEPCGRF
jgi:hypothetical protein